MLAKSPGAPIMPGMAESLKTLVAAICKKQGWAHIDHARASELTVPLSGGRSQVVELREFSHDRERLVRYTTRIGPRAACAPSRFEKALELNFSLPYGQMALEEDYLVMTETRPLKTTTPETSSFLITFIARQADLYEKVLFKQDVH